MGSFCKNHIKFQPRKYRRVISHAMKIDAKFKEKLTCDFKYDMKDLVNFPKYIRFELKKYRGVIFHDTEQ